MLNRPSLWITTVAVLAVGLSGCAGGSGKTAATTPSSQPSITTGTPTSGVSPTTEVTKAPSGPRTVAGLKSALLALDDLPSGFSMEPADNGDGGVKASSKTPGCAALVAFNNAKTAPGSKGSAEVSLSGGQDGPFIDESIDAMGSADAVKGLQAKLKSAVATCAKVVITFPGQGSSTMKVAKVSAPAYGDNPLAARMTGTSGPLAGMELTLVTAGVDDVIVSLNFVGAVADDVDGATEAAVGKAQEVLGGS